MIARYVAAGLATLVLLTHQAPLPDRLSDAEFWALSESLSETEAERRPVYMSDNLVSNEIGFQKVIPQVARDATAGRAYIGVGPEQNFTYIAAIQPAVAFIVDIRRENRDLHLVYKALFELSKDRADFLSLQFSRPRPPDVRPDADVQSLFAAFQIVAPDTTAYEENLARIKRHLTVTRRLPLSEVEYHSIDFIYGAFRRFGPDISYSSIVNERMGLKPQGRDESYRALMLATNANGELNSFLSTETRFQFVKRLEERNLIVPVVGNFGGPRALGGAGDWLRKRGAIVSTFYISNVRSYLRTPEVQQQFCQNVRALPRVADSQFIAAGQASDEVTATQARTGRGTVQLQGPPGQQEFKYFIIEPNGPAREVTEEEYHRIFPGLGLSRVGKLSELTNDCAR